MFSDSLCRPGGKPDPVTVVRDSKGVERWKKKLEEKERQRSALVTNKFTDRSSRS